MIKKMNALAVLLMSAGFAHADSFSNVSGSGKSGIGSMAKNMATNVMQTIPLWEAAFYVFALLFLIGMVYQLWSWKQTQGQKGTMGGAGICFLLMVICIAAPEMMGQGIGTFFGSGSTATVKPSSSSSPDFTGN